MPRQDESTWRIAGGELSLARPRVMGILNLTPDSFSDGGAHGGESAALDHAFKLLDEGADIIDVGGESTRPGFIPVSAEEEAARIVGVVRELLAAGAIVSVDTRHAATAKLCARLGVQIINDVTGFTDPAMVDVAAETGCGLIVCRSVSRTQDAPVRSRRMTYLDTDPRSKMGERARAKASQMADAPQDLLSAAGLAQPEVVATDAEDAAFDEEADRLEALMGDAAMRLRGSTAGAPTTRLVSPRLPRRRFTLPEAAPIMRQVMGFLGDQARELMRHGVAHDRIAIDPGAGFGTTVDEDVVIQRATTQMVSMGYPLVCAVSRKRFVGAVADVTAAQDRDAASLGVALASVAAGARIVRTHDVASFVQALDGWRAMSSDAQSRAFVAMGSNVGDRVGYLARAVKLMDEIPLTCVSAVSDAYESDPALGIATPVANAVCELRTELAPRVLLGHLQEVEKTLGRMRKDPSEGPQPRTIDLDLVFYEGERHAGRHLTVPYADLGQRDFVLVPMEDLMRDPVRYLEGAGVAVAEREDRIGIVRADLGPIDW